MTKLERAVRRMVQAEPGKRYVVQLAPSINGGMLTVRDAGRRKGYSISVPQLYVVLGWRAAEAARHERARKARGSRLHGAR